MSRQRTTRVITVVTREPWMAQGACRGTDPELFHPEKGENDTAREAVALCMTCAVCDQCLTWALETNVQDGIVGGTTPRQRRVLRTERGLTYSAPKNRIRVPR